MRGAISTIRQISEPTNQDNHLLSWFLFACSGNSQNLDWRDCEVGARVCRSCYGRCASSADASERTGTDTNVAVGWIKNNELPEAIAMPIRWNKKV